MLKIGMGVEYTQTAMDDRIERCEPIFEGLNRSLGRVENVCVIESGIDEGLPQWKTSRVMGWVGVR